MEVRGICDLGGIDGMVHVSEISHDRVNDPAEALKVGDKVRVRVLEIGRDAKGRDRISLSIKAALQDPWTQIPEEIQPSATLPGRVVRLADFGVRSASRRMRTDPRTEMGDGRLHREVLREIRGRSVLADHEDTDLADEGPIAESGRRRAWMTSKG
jgi:hypothetical protein